MKDLIHLINKAQLKTFMPLKDFHKNKEHYKVLPNRHRGLYWLSTDVDFATLKKAISKENTLKCQ